MPDGPCIVVAPSAEWSTSTLDEYDIFGVMNSRIAHALGDLAREVRVDTSERWQGLERNVMVVVHPLSGVTTPSGLDRSTGRLGVMASRHRVGLVLVSRDHVGATLEAHLPVADQALGLPDESGRGRRDNLDVWRRLEREGHRVGVGGLAEQRCCASSPHQQLARIVDDGPPFSEPERAQRAPELAVLSALAHGAGKRGLEVGRAAIDAADGLDDERSRLYADLVMNALGPAARKALEKLMASGTYQYKSDFARKYYGQGVAKGKVDGILAVLEARGLAAPPEARERIAACADLAQLDRWVRRAATCASVDELFRD